MTTTSTSRRAALDALGSDVGSVAERDPFELAAPLAALTQDDLAVLTTLSASTDPS